MLKTKGFQFLGDLLGFLAVVIKVEARGASQNV
jgi:hypothetical protein